MFLKHMTQSKITLGGGKMWLQVLLFIFLSYLWFVNKFSYWRKRGFPYAPAKCPLGSGPGIGITEHSSRFVRREYERLKRDAPAFGAYLMTWPILVPTDPELIKDILVRNFDSFQERGFLVSERADPLSQHLFFKNGKAWKELRTKLNPTFTSSRMKIMFPSIVAKTDRMIDFLTSSADRREPLEVKELFGCYSTEVIADVAFGIDTDCLGEPDNPFREMASIVFKPTALENLKLFFVISCADLAEKLNLGYTNGKVIKFFSKIVRDTLEFRRKNNVRRNDFFQLLMEMEGMSFTDIAANSFVFFLAGFETSSSVMMFTSYLLALHQDIQDRLRKEIKQILASHGGEFTYETIAEMKYLDMVFCESMRKFPVVDLQNRKCVADFTIPNTSLVIEAGTTIMIPVYCLHNDERFWKNPDEFDPERFTPENIKERHEFAYIPFSLGLRQCIGMRFGQMQAKVGLVKLLTNFRILPCAKTITPMRFIPNATFQAPVGGMWLEFERISEI